MDRWCQPSHHRRHERVRQGIDETDPEPQSAALSELADGQSDLLGILQNLTCGARQPFPGGGQDQWAGSPVDEGDAQYILQMSDSLGDGGLGHAQPLGR